MPEGSELLSMVTTTAGIYGRAPACHLSGLARNATSVVLDEGRVVGIWDLGRSDDPLTIVVAPFGRWPRRRWEAAEEQAHRIGAMIGAGSVEVARRSDPIDLAGAPRNRFLSPLSNG